MYVVGDVNPAARSQKRLRHLAPDTSAGLRLDRLRVF